MIATRQQKAQISLYRACKNNQCHRVKAAIDNGASIEQADGTAGANRPIHIAAMFGAAHVVSLLAEQHGADLNSLNAKGSTPLEVARRIGEKEVVALLEALLEGGRVHLEGHGDDDDEEVDQVAQLSLFDACRADDAGGAAAAIYRGADAGVPDSSAADNRPLHVAAVYGAVSVIEILLQYQAGRASLWSRNAEGLTPLELARRASQPRAASLLEDLLQGRQPDAGGGPLQGGGPGPAPGQGGMDLDGTVVFGNAPLPGAEQQPVNVDAFAANGQPLPQFIRMRGG